MKLKAQLFEKVKVKGLSKNTAKTYWPHFENFLRFHKDKNGKWIHPREMGTPEATEYLTWLAINRRVSPTTQNVALQSILFVYRHCLGIPLTGIDAVRAKTSKRIPTVLNRQEVKALLNELRGTHKLMALVA